MFHVRISTEQGALNFIAEVNSYNLQTLRQHVKESLRDDRTLSLSVELEPSDQRAFTRYTAGWLPRLIKAGTRVDVALSPPEDRRETPRELIPNTTRRAEGAVRGPERDSVRDTRRATAPSRPTRPRPARAGGS